MKDIIFEACTSKVCTVETFEGVAAHHVPRQRIALPHAALCSHPLYVAQGH